MSLTEALELHGLGKLGVLGDHELNLLELCEISLLVEVCDHSFQLGEGCWFSLFASRLRSIWIYARDYEHIAFSVFLACIFARPVTFFSWCFTWAFRSQVLYLRLGVDDLYCLILLERRWLLSKGLHLR